MLTAVGAFQVLIVVTLVAARFISGKYLLLTTILWSGFTLIAVFASWLLMLQLITIWATYAMLRPPAPAGKIESAHAPLNQGSHDARSDQSTIAAPPITPEAKNERTAPGGPSQERGSLSAAEGLNSYFDRQCRVQEATSALDVAIAADESHIRRALELARGQSAIARRKKDDPEFTKFYGEAHGRLSALFENSSSQKIPPASLIEAPDFNISTAGEDPSVGRLVNERVQMLKQSRDAYLDACLSELSRDPELKRYFWRATLAQEQPRLMEAFVKYAAARAKP